MKRLFPVLILSFLFFNGYTQNITDGDLNNWTLHSYSGGTYYEPINGWLMTLNKLADVPYPIGPGPVTTERTTDAYQGAYAAKLISKEFIVGVNHLFLPGAVGTFNVDIVAQVAKVGRPYTYAERPRRFKGYFKYAPVNNDSCLMLVLLSKYNAALHQKDTIAIARHTETGTFSTYTPFDIEIVYKDTLTTADTITIFVASSAYLNFANLQACHGQINSTMYVDELSFSMVSGIDMPIVPIVNVKVYPNPASESLNISTGRAVRSGKFEIFDQIGQLIKTISYKGESLTADISSLLKGKYYYKLTEKNKLLNSGSFVVAK